MFFTDLRVRYLIDLAIFHLHLFSDLVFDGHWQ
jgi:hypothetical protein